MTHFFIVAFMIGIVGSFHCIGMCGPLALSLPIAKKSILAKLSGAFIYNAGRVVTYSFLGAIFGLVGQTFFLFGFQQWLSIIAGSIILILVVLPNTNLVSNNISKSTSQFFNKLRTTLANLFNKKSSGSLFTIGLLNGFLPCGLVYMAIAGAIATGSVGSSILFMAAFGFGTLPIMWSVVFFGNFVSISLRKNIRRAYPYMMAFMACLLILRGMGLGIPYVSPKFNSQKAAAIECCSKP